MVKILVISQDFVHSQGIIKRDDSFRVIHFININYQDYLFTDFIQHVHTISFRNGKCV